MQNLAETHRITLHLKGKKYPVVVYVDSRQQAFKSRLYLICEKAIQNQSHGLHESMKFEVEKHFRKFRKFWSHNMRRWLKEYAEVLYHQRKENARVDKDQEKYFKRVEDIIKLSVLEWKRKARQHYDEEQQRLIQEEEEEKMEYERKQKELIQRSHQQKQKSGEFQQAMGHVADKFLTKTDFLTYCLTTWLRKAEFLHNSHPFENLTFMVTLRQLLVNVSYQVFLPTIKISFLGNRQNFTKYLKVSQSLNNKKLRLNQTQLYKTTLICRKHS